MKTLELNGKMACFYKPRGKATEIEYIPEHNRIRYASDGLRRLSEPLPSGNWSILGWSDEITEEQAKGIVQFVGMPWNAYKDYTNNSNWFATALHAFQSILAKEGITNRVLVIVESK